MRSILAGIIGFGYTFNLALAQGPVPAVGIGTGMSVDVETINEERFEGRRTFVAKFVCGEIEPSDPAAPASGRPLAPGSYRTAVNLYNLARGPFGWVYWIRASVAGRPDLGSPERLAPSLSPGEARELDCKDIAALFDSAFPFFAEGFLEISGARTNRLSIRVVGVYTVKNVDFSTQNPQPNEPAVP
jgi:hypothetical protein